MQVGIRYSKRPTIVAAVALVTACSDIGRALGDGSIDDGLDGPSILNDALADGDLDAGAEPTDSWTMMSIKGAPEARWLHTAVWTGTLALIWGGLRGDSESLNTGGAYCPMSNTWLDLPADPWLADLKEGRWEHTAIWTGTTMVVWGGFFPAPASHGRIYDPSILSWSAVSPIDEPEDRYYHTAVWTGTEMIVWGGTALGTLDTGGRYDAGSDSWAPTSTDNAPQARSDHTAVWTGAEMIVWGGASAGVLFTEGARYDPVTDAWQPMSETGAPSARGYHTAVWSGPLCQCG